jgi:hypothetical protein
MRVYYEQIQQQEEAANQQREAAEKAEKQRTEATEFGVTVEILIPYKALVVSLGEYQHQLRYKQLQAMIDKATDEMNNDLVRTLVDERKLVTLPSTTYTNEGISRDVEKVISNCTAHYKELSQQESFNGEVADRCVHTLKLLKSLLCQLKTNTVDADIEAIKVYLSEVQQSYKPLNNLPSITIFKKTDSNDDYGVKEETAGTLGLSPTLTIYITA